MTVASTTNRVSYAGNGTTTDFAFPHPYRASSDLVVTLRTTATGAEVAQVEGVNYTVSGTPTSDAGGFASATVSFGSAPASGTQVHIDRIVARTQTTDYVAGDGIPPSSIEGSLDKLTQLVQELDSRFERTLLQPRTAANRNLVLPEPTSANAGRVLGVNDAGSAFEMRVAGTTPVQNFNSVASVAASTIATTVMWAMTAGYYAAGDGGGALYKRAGSVPSHNGYTTSNGGSVYWELAETTPNVKMFGALGNNTGNDAPAIQNAIGFFGSAGGRLMFPPGNYRITNSINVSAAVLMEGVGSGSVYQPAQTSATALTWAGSAGGDVVRFGGFGALVSGGGIIGMKIDGRASAANGLRIKDSQRAYFRDVLITGTTANGLLMENSNNAGAFDPTGFHIFDDLRIQLRGGATNNSRGIYVNGSGTGIEGVTLCTFRRCRIDHANAAGVEIGNIGDFFTWESLQTFRADVETGLGVWFSSVSASAVCGGHAFIHCNVSAGYRFDQPNVHYQTRIINTGHIDVNPGVNMLFGRGSGDVVMDTGLGFAYGQGLLQPVHVFKRRDNCALIRHDTTNSVLHTADGNWRTSVSAGGSINANGQPGSGLDLSTGSTAGDITAMFDNSALGGGDGFSTLVGFCGDFLVAPVSNTAVVLRLGWATSTGATPTDGVYLEYDPSASANWRLICRSGGTATTVTSTVAVQVLARQEVYLFVEPGSAGVSAYFRSANNKLFALIGTITTNIPTIAGSTMCWIRTTAAASKRADIYGVKVGALDEV